MGRWFVTVNLEAGGGRRQNAERRGSSPTVREGVDFVRAVDVLKVAQHFSAGKPSPNKSKARFSGRRIQNRER